MDIAKSVVLDAVPYLHLFLLKYVPIARAALHSFMFFLQIKLLINCYGC